MFVLSFVCFCFSRPVFYIPGLAESSLYATVADPSLYPSCNGLNLTNGTKTQIWPAKTDKALACAASLLDTVYDSAKGAAASPEGVVIESDQIVEGKIGLFQKVDADVYVVNYDWVHHYIGPNSATVYSALKNKIEESVATNESNKAIIVSVSLGGHFLRYFLSHVVDDDWKQKNIEGVQFIAPCLAGAFAAAFAAATGDAYVFEMYNASFIKHAPVLYSLFPNFELNKEVVYKADGSILGASDLFSFLNESGHFDETSQKIYSLVLETLNEKLPDTNVKTSIVYNSGIPVVTGIKYLNETSSEPVFGKGDAVVPSGPIEFACKNWKNVECYDLNDTAITHNDFGKSDVVLELISKFINVDYPTATPTPFSPTFKKGGLSAYAIIGIIAGVTFVAIIITTFIIYWIIKKAKSYGVDLEENLIADDIKQL